MISTDPGGNELVQSMDIYVVDKNESPESIQISKANFDSAIPGGTTVATFSTTDPDANDNFSYSFVSGDRDIDNHLFTINGDQLIINSAPSYESKNIYFVRIRSADSGNLWFEKSFKLNVNEPLGPKDANNNGLVDGLTNYHIFHNGESIALTNRRGRSYSDASTKSWDAIAATSNGSGFQVLLDGASKREGKYYIWDINSSGVITNGSGWKSADQAAQLGWETKFNSDLNGDNALAEVQRQDLF